MPDQALIEALESLRESYGQRQKMTNNLLAALKSTGSTLGKAGRTLREYSEASPSAGAQSLGQALQTFSTLRVKDEAIDPLLPDLRREAKQLTSLTAQIKDALAALRAESAPGDPPPDAAALLAALGQAVQRALDQLRATDPATLPNAARELDATLLMGLPEDAKLPRGLKLVSFPDAEPASGGKRHSHVKRPADLSTFSADATQAEVVNGTTARSMRIDDVVALFSFRDGTRQLVGRDGSVLEMEARQWFNGDELADALDAAVPAELHIPMPDREVTFKRLGVAERCAIGFGRAANTKPGLIVLMSVMLLLTIWSLVGGHRFITVALLALGGMLGAQLWRIEGGQLGTSSTPPSPGTA